MKRIEYVLWSILLGAIFFKYLNAFKFGGYGPILLVSSGTLNNFYMILSVGYFNNVVMNKNTNYKSINKFRYRLGILFGISFGVLILSVLFKIMFWPGNLFLGKVGMVLLLISSIGLFYYEKDKESYFFKKVISRILIIGSFGALFFFLSEDNLVDIQWRNYPRYKEAKKAYLKVIDNKELKKKADKILEEEEKINSN